MNEEVKQIAARIKELRTLLGRTAEDMAAVTNLPVSDYVAGESGESDLSFTFVHNCAKALGVDITDLMTGVSPRMTSMSVVRAGEGLKLERRRGFDYSHLASNFKGRLSEPFLVRAKYDAEAQDKPIPLAMHAGEEFDYVLSGKLKVSISGREEVLGPGDAVYYNSSEPHGMIAADGGDCMFLAVVTDAAGHAADYNPDLLAAPVSETHTVRYNDFVTAVENEKNELVDIEFTDTDRYNFAFDTVDALADREPDRLAMIHVAMDHTERRLTFSDVKKMSARAANYFESVGIKKGDRVMLVLRRHVQFWYAVLGLCKMGAIPIPATHQLMKKDFVYRFNTAGVSAIVCTATDQTAGEVDLAVPESPSLKLKIMAEGRRDGWLSFDDGIAGASDVYERRPDTPCGDDNMLMLFSSGTSGYPKVVMHSHTYPLGHFVTAKYWHDVDPNGLHLTISDTGWGKALWGKLYGQWLCGGAVFVYDFDRFDPGDILPMFAKYHITTFCAPPTMYRFFIKYNLSKFDLSSIKYATVAGEALNPEVYQQWLNATGVKLMEGFGQTETTLTVGNLIGMNPKPGSMGRPSPMYDIAVLDPDGKPVKPGETGEICVKTDGSGAEDPGKRQVGLFLGYYSDTAPDHVSRELTDAAWHDGWYHTGDTAWADEDGYLWYVGRNDDLIKSSGYRIGPFEIESVIMELPYVLECAVTAVPDPIRGQAVKATIVCVKGTETSEALKKDVQNYVKTHTAPYKYPRVVEFVDELPKTISGKIRRNVLRAQDEKKS